MYYKNFFSATSLVALLGCLSSAAFSSSPIGPIDDEETSYYIRLQYNGEFSPFKTEINTIQYQDNQNKVFDPFKASFISGSGALGYKMDDIRVDIEGIYSQLNKNVISGTEKSENTKIADSLSVISGLINMYYDLEIEDMTITPYVGVGVGASYLSNPSASDDVKDQKKFGFAYQAKAGVSYDLTQEIKLFAGARYFGSYGATFDKEAKNDGGINKVVYGTLGGEAGVVFNF